MNVAAAAAAVVVSGNAALAALTHRYTFSGDANDSVGTAHGTLVNGASVGGSELALFNNGTNNNPATGQYVDLPNNIARTSSFTIEGWATWNGGNDWQRIFDFGNGSLGELAPGDNRTGSGGTEFYYVTPRSGNDPANGRLRNYNGEVRDNNVSNFVNARTATNQPMFWDLGVQHHFALTRDASNNTLSLYFDGQLVGQSTNATVDPAGINMVNVWLGRSQFQGDAFFNGLINEFRIYDNAIGAQGIGESFAAGPDNIAAETFWQVANGNWATGTNWSGGSAPGPGSIATIANAGTSNLSSDAGTVAVTRINDGALNVNTGGALTTLVNLAPGGAGTATLNVNGGRLTTSRILVDNGTGAKSITIGNGGTLAMTGSFTLSGTNLTTTVGAGGATFETAPTTEVNWTPPLAGNGTFNKTGSGRLNLAGGGYDGPLNVRAGWLTAAGSVGAPGTPIQLGDTGTPGGNAALLYLTAPGTIRGPINVGTAGSFGDYFLGAMNDTAVSIPEAVVLNSPLTIYNEPTSGTNALRITGGISAGAGSGLMDLIFSNSGKVIVEGGAISDGAGGPISLVKNGTQGVLVLNSPNTYTGPTTINGGMILFKDPSTIGGSGQSVFILPGGVGAAGEGFDHTNLKGTFLNRINPLSEGAFALTKNSSEDFNFDALGYGTIFMGAASNVAYTGTITPAQFTYRLGGGGGTLTLPNTNAITGSNLLQVGGRGGGTVELTAPNDFTGGTTVMNGGTLAISNENQTGSGPMTLNSGTLQFNGTAPFTFTKLISVEGEIVTLRVENPAGVTLTGGMNTLGGDANPIQKTGPGRLTLDAANFQAGGKPIVIRSGTLSLPGNAVLSTNAHLSVSNEGTERATLDLGGTSQVSVGTAFNVGDLGESRGTLFVRDSAQVNLTTLYVGKNQLTQGAVRQTGGTVMQGATAPGEWRIGGSFSTADANAVGTYTITAGQLSTSGNLQVGAWGRGALTVQGGVVRSNTFPAIGRFPGSYGSVMVEGTGSYEQTNPTTLNIVGEQGIGILNVANGGTASSSGSLRLGLAVAGAGHVNLLPGGTIVASSVSAGGGQSTFNFHGGTLKPSTNTTAFMGGLNNAYVYQGGAVIDTDGKNITISQALKAPTGEGVGSIALAGGGANYVAHPLVEITGGGGTGAAAVAVLNAAGQVTGIRVTNPGVGYTSAPTVTIRGGGTDSAATAGAVTLANNVGGGLTKVGAGTLTLAAPNTYTGPTVISAGTLKLPTAAPGGTGLTHRYSFNDGTANDSVGGAPGTLVNGASVTNNRLVLANNGTNNSPTSGAYVDLPNNIARTSSFTVEGWATWGGGGDWQRFFDFGTNTLGEQAPGNSTTGYTGTSYYFVTPRTGNDPANARLTNLNGEVRVNPNSNLINARDPGNQPFAFPIGSEHHFALTRDANSNTLSLYYDGQLVARTAGTLDPSVIEMVNVWIGRSNWQADPFFSGSFDEFRIYDLAVGSAGIGANFAAGPDGAINQIPDPSTQVAYIPVSSPVSIPNAGATLDLAGQTARIGSLSGVAGSLVTLGGGTLATGADNTSTTFAGDITGAGNVIKEGTGAWTVSSSGHTYTGSTTVNGGTLRVTGSVNNSSGVTVNTGGTFEAGATQDVKSLTVNTGGKAVVGPNGPSTVLTTNALSLGGGHVDLTTNAMVLDYAPAGPNPITDIRAAIASGYNNGAWNGPGIITSTAQTTPGRAVGYADAFTLYGPEGGVFLGKDVDASSILLRHTISGDADLNGSVAFPDLVALAQNYNTLDGSAVWTEGDFNYDGNVSFPDLVMLAQNYNSSVPAAAQLEAMGIGAAFHQDMAAAFAQVPEPGALSVLVLGTTALAGRRRRRR